MDTSRQAASLSDEVRGRDRDDGWETVILRSLDQIEDIRPIWEEMQAEQPCPMINADIDRYLAFQRTMEQDCRPLVLILEREGRPRAMVVGRLGKQSIPLRLGYKVVARPALRCVTVIYGGVLAPADEAVADRLVRALMGFLRRREADAIYFNHLRTDSPFYRQVTALPHFLCRSHFPAVHPHWQMSMPETLEEFYQRLSKKHRGNIRRAIKKLEEEWKDQLEIVHYSRPQEVDRLSEDVERVSVKTYQQSLGAGFQNTPLMQSISQTDAQHGRLHVSVLYVQKQPCAFQWGTTFAGTYFLERIGYDPAWTKSSVGTVLFVKVLERLCGESGVERMDFGFGTADYKESYGSESWQEAATTYILAPRLYPLFVGALESANAGLVRALTRVAGRAVLLARVKRLWRRTLQKTALSRKPASDPDGEAT